MIARLEAALVRYEHLLDGVLARGGAGFLIVATLVVVAGQLRSCVGVAKVPQGKPPEILQLDLAQESQQRLASALGRVVKTTGGIPPQAALVKSDEVNAASFGEGRYLLWEGLEQLPDSALDAILAHEAAHDKLLHSVRAQDMNDFVAFWTELIGTVGRADLAASQVISDWGQNLVMPKYSRNQEQEADRVAIDILGAVGYENPRETYAATMELLLNRYGDTGGGFLDNHPATSERIRQARSGRQ